MDYKPLPDTYTKPGYCYTLTARNEHVAVYAQNDAETGRLVAFEVCRILRHDGRVIAGNVVAPAEFLPSSEQWGQQAWTCGTGAAAHAKYLEQTNLLSARQQVA